MTCTTVRDQQQLDAALASDATCIHIESEAGVWLRLSSSGSATVRASGSATVEAFGSATVEAFDSATVEGGVLIDLTTLDLRDPRTWCEHHGVDITDGRAVLYKATDQDLTAGQGWTPTRYDLGAVVTAPDWEDNHSCGYGLHVSPRPWQAASYQNAAQLRYLRISVALDELRPISADKAKARTLQVEAEVDLDGTDLVPAEATS